MKTPLYSAIMTTAAIAMSPISQAQISLSVNIAPPALPVYAQPSIPGDGYMWTPGYWSWNADDSDYYWVPGTWVNAPFVGALWTPGYWGWGDSGYAWHGGYWGTHMGYYGGINYGFGYTGVGYQGGYWDHGSFSYNRSVNNVGSGHIAHIYNTKVDSPAISRISYNGGKGGVQLRPTRAEAGIAAMPHNAQTTSQAQHEQAARTTQTLRASVNHGMPKVAATPEPGAFAAPNVVAAQGTPAQPASRSHGGNTQSPSAMPEQNHAQNRQSAEPVMPHPQPTEKPVAQENMREQARAEQPPKEAPHPARAHEGEPKEHEEHRP